MGYSLAISAIDASRQLVGTAPPYAALIAAVGYEARASHIARHAKPGLFANVWAYEYEHNRVLSYEDNRKFFRSVGTTYAEADSAYRKHLSQLIRERSAEIREAQRSIGLNDVVRFAVDISSMDRDRLARTVLSFAADQDEPVEVDFYYSAAEFDATLSGSEGRVVVNRSVEGLEGWTANPGLPIVCIIGLGFEGRLALAALETLEPAQTVWLVPHGVDVAYDSIVYARNILVLNDAATSIYSYDVTEPYSCLLNLEASAASLSLNNRVVIVPLGPKIFALLAILTGLAHDNNVSVWRLSADSERRPEDRRASDTVVGLRVRFNNFEL